MKILEHSDKVALVRVPALRFPEFRDFEAWKVNNLIDVADKKIKWSFIGGPFGSNLKASDYTGNDGIRIIQLQNIGDAEFINEYKIFTSVNKADELLANNIYPGDIILSKMGDPVARACIIPDYHHRYLMCSDGIRLTVDERRFCKYFIYSVINSAQFRTIAEKAATGSTRKRIGLDNLKCLPILSPQLIEQQKIADCLSSLDNVISLQTQKIEALQQYKKGLMQKMFPAEGETVPELRFGEFLNTPEWNPTTVGSKAIKVGSGITPKGGNINYKSKGRPFIRSQNIGWGSLLLDDVVFIDDETHSTFSSSEIKNGDVLLNITGASIGRCTVANSSIQGGNVNQHVCIIRTNKSELEPSFLNQYLLSFEGQKQIDSFQAGGNRQGLNFAQIRSFSLPLPQLKEQQKITDCLSSLDELIVAETQKLYVLRTHKTGLMQQLFPVMDEVNA